MATNPKQERLSIPQLGEIINKHAPTGNAIRIIVDWLNKNVIPQQGNKVTK